MYYNNIELYTRIYHTHVSNIIDIKKIVEQIMD